jgi:hypothetical protein
MEYTVFVAGFTDHPRARIHLAGMVELQFADFISRGEDRRVDFVRGMTIPEESSRIGRVFLPVQLARGVLMAFVLLPLLGPIGDLM